MQTPAHDLAWFNELGTEEARKELLKCCGAARWTEAVEQSRPYRTLEELIARANEIWSSLTERDWLEAFRSHPKIGEKKAAQPVAAQSQQWSAQEQRGVQNATPEAVTNLARLNREYEEKFGFIFIVCATGMSSDEILALLEQRLQNERAGELPIAAAEQAKITELRL
ncbi:MAG TPA: 2-oxo-4-hydroxy-4-carboxy-5-ureidoimidazoline decarboxylase, partial [Pyrinomonadaceae bacterium]|nr:2-oxo-4-hydroxy-4-carboxy-5-ureidoimidazoline decarboxylase [Pyrinomonadaceae bacterium]